MPRASSATRVAPPRAFTSLPSDGQRRRNRQREARHAPASAWRVPWRPWQPPALGPTRHHGRDAPTPASARIGAPVSCTLGRRHPAATPTHRGHGSRGRNMASTGSTDARRCALRASWREGPIPTPAGREVWAGPSRGAAERVRCRRGRVVPHPGAGTPRRFADGV
jgi:hypothetical protein